MGLFVCIAGICRSLWTWKGQELSCSVLYDVCDDVVILMKNVR